MVQTPGSMRRRGRSGGIRVQLRQGWQVTKNMAAHHQMVMTVTAQAKIGTQRHVHAGPGVDAVSQEGVGVPEGATHAAAAAGVGAVAAHGAAAGAVVGTPQTPAVAAMTTCSGRGQHPSHLAGCNTMAQVALSNSSTTALACSHHLHKMACSSRCVKATLLTQVNRSSSNTGLMLPLVISSSSACLKLQLVVSSSRGDLESMLVFSSSSSVCLHMRPLLQNRRCRRSSSGSSSICLRVLALLQLSSCNSRGLQAQVLAQFTAAFGSSRDRLPVLRP